MIRRLKNRMILLVLIGLLLASAGLVSAIHWMNWNSLSKQANAVLDILAENGGRRPSFAFRGIGNAFRNNRETEETPPVKPEGTQPPWMLEKQEGRDRQRTSAQQNAASLSNSYTVTLNADGSVSSWQSDRADLYSDEEMEAFAAAVLQSGKTSGRVDTQFFRLLDADESDCRLLIAVDSRLEIQNVENVLRVTILVALAEDAALSLAAIWLICRLV